MKEEIVNAKIAETMLGREDHGIMTAMLTLDFGGSRQGFGGYSLTADDALHIFVKGCLDVCGKEIWENLVGQNIRVKRVAGWNGKIIAIGHFLEDKWFNPEQAFKALKNK